MTHLRPDYLVFKISTGESIPCSAETVTVELMGDAVQFLDQQLIKDAAESVLYYFKTELKRTCVSVAEFSRALEKVLRGFGLEVRADGPSDEQEQVVYGDLAQLAVECGPGCELIFFPRLRQELRDKLSQSPRVLRFDGLRRCVKNLTGAKRWSLRCQALSDQIVEYMRGCLSERRGMTACALVVQ